MKLRIGNGGHLTVGNTVVPLLLLELANSKKPKRPSGMRKTYLADPLENRETFLDFLRQLKYPHISYDEIISLPLDLDEIRSLREIVEQAVFHLVEKKTVEPDIIVRLNKTAADCSWIRQLTVDCRYTERLHSGTLAGMAASICILELTNCEIERIKVCSRNSCGLYFYDTTRNRSARWHAENPCGWRTRSERRN